MQTVTITPLDVARGVADAINAAAWSQTFAACTRRWLPDYTDERLQLLQIAVLPIDRQRERLGHVFAAGQLGT